MNLKTHPRWVRARDCTALAMVSGNEKLFDTVIDRNTVMNWVGFAWVSDGEPTPTELLNYPVVVHEKDKIPRRRKEKP